MIENGDAHSFSVHRAVVVGPFGAFAPAGVVTDAGALDDVTFAGFFAVGEAHRFGKAGGHGAFFGVTKVNGFIARSDQSDFEIEQAFVVRPVVDPNRALIGAFQRAVVGDPFIARFDHADVIAGFYFDEFVVCDLIPFFFL